MQNPHFASDTRVRLLHDEFVEIHPSINGNCRTARLPPNFEHLNK
ncbi:MAG TPA: hypothetical protein VFC79_08010 [Tissierellaceae bacterium]|nr:hypothetical protein [Tissierellaceae bacterium]